MKDYVKSILGHALSADKAEGPKGNTLNIDLKQSCINVDKINVGDTYELSLPEQLVDKLSDQIVQKLAAVNIEKPLIAANLNQQSTDEISRLITEAENYQRKRLFLKAIDCYIAITTNPATASKLDSHALFSINNNLSICYINLSAIPDHLNKARRHLDAADGLKTGQEEKYCLVNAWYYCEIRNFKEAFSNLQSALQIKPDYVKALNTMAIVRLCLGEESDKIIKDIYLDVNENLKEVFINDQSAYFNLGQLYSKNNEFDLAIYSFELCITKGQNEFYAMAMLGETILVKALGGRREVVDLHISSDTNVELLNLAIYHLENAFDLARALNLEELIAEYLICLVTAYLILGRHSQAYEKINKAIQLGLTDDEVISKKAKIEILKGELQKARQTYGGLKTTNSYIDKCQILMLENRYSEAINGYESLLANHALLKADELIICRELLAESYLCNQQFSDCHSVLLQIKDSHNETWNTEIIWGRYYLGLGEINKAKECFEKAIERSDFNIRAIIESVTFYGTIKDYFKIIELITYILFINFSILANPLFKGQLYRYLARAYYFTANFFQAINVSVEALKSGVESRWVQDILIESYVAVKNYRAALKILSSINAEQSPDFKVLTRIAYCYIYIGKPEESLKYLQQAESLNVPNNDNNFYLNYSQTWLLIGDEKKALEYAKKALDLNIDFPKSPVHAYYAHVCSRCGQDDESFKYIAAYHENYPKADWIKVFKTLEQDETGQNKLSPEILNIINSKITFFNNGINQYKFNHWPLCFLKKYFQKSYPEILSWRQLYNLPIEINSGLQKHHNDELQNIATTDTLLIDYTSLLILEQLKVLDLCFDDFHFIHISQSLFNDVQIDVLNQRDTSIRSIWDKLRTHKNIKFILPYEYDAELFNKKIIDDIGESVVDEFNYAKDSQVVFCIGDERWKSLARNEGLKTTGIISILERLVQKKKLTSSELASLKLKLIKENYFFVSFNTNEILTIASQSSFSLESVECLFDVVLKGNPDLYSFVNVYIETILWMFKNRIHIQVTSVWLSKLTKNFQKLFVRFLNFEYNINLPQSARINLPEKELTNNLVLCFSFIELLLTIVFFYDGDDFKNPNFLAIKEEITYPELAEAFYNQFIQSAKQRASEYRNKFSLLETLEKN